MYWVAYRTVLVRYSIKRACGGDKDEATSRSPHAGMARNVVGGIAGDGVWHVPGQISSIGASNEEQRGGNDFCGTVHRTGALRCVHQVFNGRVTNRPDAAVRGVVFYG